MEYFTEFASGVEDGDFVIGKTVTAETLMGRLDKENGKLCDVALIVPAKPKEQDETDTTKASFYVLPYGFPLIKAIRGENISLRFVIKVFPITSVMENLVEHYENVRDNVESGGKADGA